MKSGHFPGSGFFFDLRSQKVDDYAVGEPKLDFREYFDGSLQSSGIFNGLSGKVERKFTLRMDCRWQGQKGTLDEYFSYDDGETGHRCWSLNFVDENNFSATALDVEGVGQGAQRGNAAVMRYRLRVPRVGGKEVVVSMEDWFYLIEDGTVINRARMSKFGIKVGEIVASFQKSVRTRSLDIGSAT